ncbi:chitin synthase [Plakobranchus ocellatus]|uniref:Chitin synthase n=1 Tax=Plakobranchus ocellatus TaxID=259542 RepID=A0AAV3Z662_9GAST|nr:chitin synthase [Plakobranchus ocellatus]
MANLRSQEEEAAGPSTYGSQHEGPHTRLTVQQKWRVEEEFAAKEEEKSSMWLPILAKWLITILMAAILTFLLVVSKLSFLTLSMQLARQKPSADINEDNVSEWTGYTGQMLMIFLVLLVPYALQFLRALANVLCVVSAPWPQCSGVAACFAVALLEVTGLSLLALKVVPAYGPRLGVLVMGGSVILSLSWTVLQIIYRRIRSNGSKTCWFGVISLLCLFGECMTNLVYSRIVFTKLLSWSTVYSYERLLSHVRDDSVKQQ